MLLAALQSVPKDIYESADIDGAGRWTKLFYVTIPFIKSTIILTVLLRVIWVFNSADLIYIMTNGDLLTLRIICHRTYSIKFHIRRISGKRPLLVYSC